MNEGQKLLIESEAVAQEHAWAFGCAGRERASARLIHGLFEEQVCRRCDTVAISYNDELLTYGDLNKRANKIAHALISHGVRAEMLVGIVADRSTDLIAGMLGVLKAGGAYVPLDPAYPRDRLEFMLKDSAAVVALIGAEFADKLSGTRVPHLIFGEEFAQPDANPMVGGLTSRNLAYLLYTSGSTGIPKGVLIEHRSVLRLVVESAYAQISPTDCVAHCSSPSFDAATWEVWAALLNGARVQIVAHDIMLNPAKLERILIRGEVNALMLTTGLFDAYADALELAFARLKYLLVGGDVLNPSAAARVLSKVRRPQHFLNVYGPTETTTFATSSLVESVENFDSAVSIGQPITDTTIHILNDSFEPVDIGDEGQIHVGGLGVARGYLNQPGLTAERFVPDPFADSADARLYRSGDLARRTDDSNIAFLGRVDSQVKIRGFRIELGEIEAALRRCIGVAQAMVVVRGEGSAGKYLTAYVVSHDGIRNTADEVDSCSVDKEREMLIEGLRRELAKSLPDFMVPQYIVLLAAFPLTTNGKVDRALLPAPAVLGRADSAQVVLQGSTQQGLANIWEELLGVHHLTESSDFLAMGGHSIAAMKLIVKLAQRFGVQVELHEVLRDSSLQSMASLIDQRISVCSIDSVHIANEFEDGVI